jgi:hypothetical protein
MPITIKRKDTGKTQVIDIDTFRTQYNVSLYDIVKRENIVEMSYFNSNWGTWVSPTLTERGNAEKWINEQPNNYKFEPVPDFDNNPNQAENILEHQLKKPKYEQTASDILLNNIRDKHYRDLEERLTKSPSKIDASKQPIKTNHSSIGWVKKLVMSISLKNIIEMIIAGLIVAIGIYWYHLNALRK